MTAKHDFISDNPHIAYSDRDNAATPGFVIVNLKIDGDTMTGDKSPSEVFEAFNSGIMPIFKSNIVEDDVITWVNVYTSYSVAIYAKEISINTGDGYIVGYVEADEWSID